MSSLSNVCDLSNNVFSAITEGIAPCKYFSTSNFSSLKLSFENIFILHLNIRSLNKNYDDLYELISEFPHPFDLVCLSETKLKNNTHVNIQIRGYQFVHVDSASNAGDMGIYISDNNELNHASPYSITVDGCENIWISINTNTSQKYLIGLIYRHPKSNVFEFTAKFNECLQKVNGANIKCIVLGDYNIYLLNNTAASVISYLHMLNSNALIFKSTRVTETSSTLIDHIYCNDINCDIVPGVYNYEISDHFPIFASIRNVKEKPSLKPAVNEYRSMVKFEPLKYCNSLQVALKNLFDDHTELTTNNFDNSFQFFYKLSVL